MRANPTGTSVVARFSFGDFELDEAVQELRRRGAKVRIRPTPYRLLVYLVRHRDRVVPRDELLDQVWGGIRVSEATLASTLNAVRLALGDNAASPRWIETRRRQGYRFVGDVRENERRENGHASRGRGRRARILWACGGLAVLATFGLTVASGWKPFRSTDEPIRSLAVLPLEDLSGDGGPDYLADGLTEALIAALGTLGETPRVISRSSVTPYKGTRKSTRQIAEELGVDALIEGTVRREADRVHVSVRLVDGREERPLWARSYERDLRSALALQSEIALDVSDRVRLELDPRARRRPAIATAVDPRAQDAYFRGRYRTVSEYGEVRGMEPAIDDLRRAVELQPDFALAHVALSDAYFLSAGWTRRVDEGMALAREAARTALELDERLSEAHDRLGWVALEYDWDWDEARKGFERALQLNPNNPSAHLGLAHYFSSLGRHQEAIQAGKRRLELAPLDLLGRLSHATIILSNAREFERALQEMNAILAVSPRSVVALLGILNASTYAGRPEECLEGYKRLALLVGLGVEAERAIDRTFREWGAGVEACSRLRLASLYRHLDGNPEWTPALSRRYRELAQDTAPVAATGPKRKISSRDSFELASVYALVGDGEQALQWLEHGFEQRSSSYVFLNVNPAFDSLRSDGRFLDIVRRVGIPSAASAFRSGQ